MHLLELPTELVHQILLEAVISRGVKRAVRLRLVNKRFYRDIPYVIYASRLLDSFRVLHRFCIPKISSHWNTDKNHGTMEFWHSYIVYRVQNTSSDSRCLAIRHVAQRVCDETGADLLTTIQNLSWPALFIFIRYEGYWREEETQPANPDIDLLCAAAYLNLLELAAQLVKRGVSPADESRFFASPMRLAALAGNKQMLEMLQEAVPEALEVLQETLPMPTPYMPREPSLYRGKVHRGAIIGAAINGDLDLVKLAIYPPSRSMPSSTDINGQKCGHVWQFSHTGWSIQLAQSQTRNLDIYKYLQSLVVLEENDCNFRLKKQAEWGHVHMVRYLLDAGGNINGVPSGDWSTPLLAACRRGHPDVVSLLLERGANPDITDVEDDRGGLPIDPPMLVAAQGGSLTILRQLVEHGAKVGFQEALRCAIGHEHTAMVKYLLDLGKKGVFDLSQEYLEEMIKHARDFGWDSMVDLLLEEGVATEAESMASGLKLE